MAGTNIYICALFSLFLLLNLVWSNNILCEEGFCEEYRHKEGCVTPPVHCEANNATHQGIRLPSPTQCNCCDYCLPFIGEGEHCNAGGPGLGITVGRCADGLTCTADAQDWTTCTRIQSKCHSAQDAFDAKQRQGQLGALEERPECDGKGKYSPYECIPAHTCFCQSEEGERIFGEVLNLGAITKRTMRCGCSRFHERIKKSISPYVPIPVIGPRCTSDGNFHPIQCIGNICHCVDIHTGIIDDNIKSIDLETTPVTELACYDEDTDIFPHYSKGDPPYNFTTPCLAAATAKIDLILRSEEEGFNIDYFNSFPECYPDGTYGRTAVTRTGKKVCIDERGRQIENYGVEMSSPDYNDIDCKCAQTVQIMSSVPEKPICCKNGSFRPIQCRRGVCRCVDADGRQTTVEMADITLLPCYKTDWKTC